MGIPPPKENPVDVVIITALKDELDAVLAYEPVGQGQERWERKSDRHGFPFYVREFLTKNGELLHVAAAWSGGMGESAAATHATTLIDELAPSCLAMCGICAGKRGDISLGDVIVADKVYSYDHGKLVVGGGKEPELFHDIETYNLQKQWLVAVTDFARSFPESWEGARSRPPSRQAQKRWLLHALHAHEEQGAPSPGERPDRQEHCPGWIRILTELTEEGLLEKRRGRLNLAKVGLDWLANDRLERPDGPLGDPAFRVHIGSIASGKTVRQDPELFTRLEHLVRKTIGVEMEAAAIGAVAEKFGRRAIIVKAVSDYADHEKDDTFRLFACKASAEFLLGFLRSEAAGSKRGWRDSRDGTMPVPRYPDGETRRLSLQLDGARERKRQLQKVGASTEQVDREIVELRRLLREGGRLRAGGPLGGDRFLLLESVGQGGFATVWKALDRKTQETVAIKVLHPNLAGADDRRERFFRGARRMAELEHPAVVRVIEKYGEDNGYFYFVMEYVTGGNLRQAVLNKTITLDKLVSIVLRIGEALALAHSRGIIHRDIKPANILIDAQGQPLLTDFDLVRALDSTGGTRTGALGTAAYAAPECLERPQDADPRADVYSLGMTAVFGVHGTELPFSRIIGNREKFFSQLPCPEPLKKVLVRATSLEPSARYADAAEFIKAVQHASHSLRNASVPPRRDEESDVTTQPWTGDLRTRALAVDEREAAAVKTDPDPERTQPRQVEVVTQPASLAGARISRAGALALSARALHGEEPTHEPEGTRALPPDVSPKPEKVPQSPDRRHLTGNGRQSQPTAEPAAATGNQYSYDEVLAAVAIVLKRVILGVIAVALAGGIVSFWPRLTRESDNGAGIYLTMDTNPKVNVQVLHMNSCGGSELPTDLGMTPIIGATGVHLRDALILENKVYGIYVLDEDLLRFGEPGETKSINRGFNLGNVTLRVTPRSVGLLEILREGQDLGVYLPGMKLELMEGMHKLELRGERLAEPVKFTVNVKAGETTEVLVDLSTYLRPVVAEPQ